MTRSSSRSSVFAGFLLAIIGAIIVLLDAILRVEGALNALLPPGTINIRPMIEVVLLIVLSIVSIILSIRMRRIRDVFLPLILLIVSIIIILLAGLLSMAMLGGILILIGAILVIAARN